MHWYTDVLKQYAVFTGRATRQQYWMFVLISFLISVILGIIDGVLDGEILGNIYAIAVLLPSIAVAIRRLHDTGRSAWWMLLVFIPILGWIALLVFLCQDSQPGTNQFGPNPKGVASPTQAPVAEAPVAPVPAVEKVPEAPLAESDVVINDIPVADPAVSPEEKA